MQLKTALLLQGQKTPPMIQVMASQAGGASVHGSQSLLQHAYDWEVLDFAISFNFFFAGLYSHTDLHRVISATEIEDVSTRPAALKR